MKRTICKTKNERRESRHIRVRARIKGTAEAPRLSVFRGLKNITLQLIDDEKGRTLCQATTIEAAKGKARAEGRKGKVAEAFLAGKLLAERAKAKNIGRAVFDRAGYRYHGRVEAAADGAREGGLKF